MNSFCQLQVAGNDSRKGDEGDAMHSELGAPETAINDYDWMLEHMKTLDLALADANAQIEFLRRALSEANRERDGLARELRVERAESSYLKRANKRLQERASQR